MPLAEHKYNVLGYEQLCSHSELSFYDKTMLSSDMISYFITLITFVLSLVHCRSLCIKSATRLRYGSPDLSYATIHGIRTLKKTM